MLSVLSNRIYRHLFMAQVIALLGTGLTTVALGLLAFDIAGPNAGAVLGTALAIKMVAYIGIAPVVGAFADRLPRRGFLVAMDVVRASVALALPFVSEAWHIYVLIFVLQSASAAFTPTFQATIPDVLPEEKDYTRALSLSRLAYDLESLASPALAAALLSVMSFHWLFSGTTFGFVASALLVATTRLPRPASGAPRAGGIFEKTTRGIRIYLKTPRLRGLLALTLAAAAASAMVIVNTVVIVRDVLGLSQGAVAMALAAYGGGSMIAALSLPKVLDHFTDRLVMTFAAAALAVLLGALAFSFRTLSGQSLWPVILAGWFFMGMAYAMTVTPSGRLLRRSGNPEDRPTLFAAQFALSHACWLIAYPLSGFLGSGFGQSAALVGMAGIALLGTLLAVLLWSGADRDIVQHSHPDLPSDHPHLREGHASGAPQHAFVIDDLHTHWPKRAATTRSVQ